MRYTTKLNNQKCLEWGLSLSESVVFSWLYELPSWADTITDGGKIYYFAHRTKAIEELPLVTEKEDTMYRHYKSLEEKGLVETKKMNGKDFIALSDKAKTWNELGKKSDNSEKNPSELGKISEKVAFTPYSMISTTNDKELTEEIFETFRRAYPGSKNGHTVEYDNFTRKHKDYKSVVHLLLPALNKLEQWRTEAKKVGQFVPEYANLSTWINQRRWEAEMAKIETATPPSQETFKLPPPKQGFEWKRNPVTGQWIEKPIVA
jgi:DNA-binding transcriptional ArsR family regulator